MHNFIQRYNHGNDPESLGELRWHTMTQILEVIGKAFSCNLRCKKPATAYFVVQEIQRLTPWLDWTKVLI